jgi:hypothetical protein
MANLQIKTSIQLRRAKQHANSQRPAGNTYVCANNLSIINSIIYCGVVTASSQRLVVLLLVRGEGLVPLARARAGRCCCQRARVTKTKANTQHEI